VAAGNVGRRLRDSFAALQEREFRLLFLGQSVSLVGDGVVGVALAFAVLDLTGSASDLGVVFAARVVPLVTLLLAGGVFADRLSRRAVMVTADVARFASQGLTAGLLLTGRARIWELALLQVVNGAATAFFNPASTGLIPMTVSPDRLQQANGLRALSMSGATIAGPALGGLLVATAGAGWAMAADASSYAISAAFLVRLRLPAQDRLAGQSFVRDLREGWDEFRSRNWVWIFVTWASLGNLGTAVFTVLGAAIARQSLGGAGAWALIVAALGAGSIAGSFVALHVRLRRPLVSAALALGSFALPTAALALALPAPVIAAGALFAGGASMLANTLWETALQRNIPAVTLSRVSAYDWFGSMACAPIGYLLAGPVGAAVGFSAELWAIAGFFALSAPAVAALPSIRQIGAGGHSRDRRATDQVLTGG
jgi:predicted MFS family arabinose efflux permease